MISLFRQDGLRAAADEAYRRVVAQARSPAFFRDCGVPDTVDGRFELICLHAFLYLNRLKAEQPNGEALGQRFFDAMFADMDRSLREMGVGDLSVGREVKRMAQSFYGRVRAYEDGLAGDDRLLRLALSRNLFGTVTPPERSLAAMSAYVCRETAGLRRLPARELLAGRVAFGPAPADAAGPDAAPVAREAP